MELHDILKQITPPDGDARREAQRRWDACAKPLGSLGLLETAICDIAALTEEAFSLEGGAGILAYQQLVRSRRIDIDLTIPVDTVSARTGSGRRPYSWIRTYV